MRIQGAVALVTGANRGLGRAFASALLDSGARTVYAGVRDPSSVTDPRLFPVRLDVTDPGQVAAAAAQCGDVGILINNAGAMRASPFIGAPTTDGARNEMEVNYFGMLSLCREFAPVLERNGGGAIVNMLSAASWVTPTATGSYAASKAAAWSLTNGVRVELHSQGTLVIAVHAGFIDTEMAARVHVAKLDPDDVARLTMAAIESGTEEVLADDETRAIKAALPTALETLYPPIQAHWDERHPRRSS
ncbi:SDR family oxidoreductase [Diaminobutyricibacter sp. McL0608]|uniref:SDR family oxidoreductase n=1 Tax=Leifsonia sp. McL0608 TaxID=3143537 RepID=UPI0031F2EF53